MSLSRAEQRAILDADRRRREERELRETAALLGINVDGIKEYDPTLYVNPELVRGVGVISPPRHTSASPDSWRTRRNMMTRTVGVAPGADPSDGPSMLVTLNGVSTVVPVTRRSGTKRSRTTRTATRVAQTPDTARVSHGHNFND